MTFSLTFTDLHRLTTSQLLGCEPSSASCSPNRSNKLESLNLSIVFVLAAFQHVSGMKIEHRCQCSICILLGKLCLSGKKRANQNHVEDIVRQFIE